MKTSILVVLVMVVSLIGFSGCNESSIQCQNGCIGGNPAESNNNTATAAADPTPAPQNSEQEPIANPEPAAEPVAAPVIIPGLGTTSAPKTDSESTSAPVVLPTPAPTVIVEPAHAPVSTPVAVVESTPAPTPVATPIAVPLAPINFRAQVVSSSAIRLSWQNGSNLETTFKVERATSTSGPFVLMASLGADQSTYSIGGLSARTVYYFRLSAVNSSGSSESMYTAATTLDNVPAAPGLLIATTVSASQVNLYWQDFSDNESGFKIERAPSNSGLWSQIASMSANVRFYSDTGLDASTMYSYRVMAVNFTGSSGYSNTASVTSAAIPTPTPIATPVPTATPVALASSSSSSVSSSVQENPTNLQCVSLNASLVGLSDTSVTLNGNASVHGSVVLFGHSTLTVNGNSKLFDSASIPSRDYVKLTGRASIGHLIEKDLTKSEPALLAFASSLEVLKTTQYLNAIRSSTTLQGNGGLNVIDIRGGIYLSGNSILTLQGSAQDVFVIRVTDGIGLSGNSGIALQGSLPPKNVIFDLTGVHAILAVSGNGSISGTFFAQRGSVAISGNGKVYGALFAWRSITISGNGFSLTSAPFCPASTHGLISHPRLEEMEDEFSDEDDHE